MVAGCDVTPDCAFFDKCTVALLAPYELLETEYIDHLSIHEKTKFASIGNRVRKRNWLAGRILAKYLFLDRLQGVHRENNQATSPMLLGLSPHALGSYSPWMYQKIEILSHAGAARPRLIWCDRDRAESVSISHADVLSCACLASEGPVAVDIETVAPRIAAFYRSNFAEAERRWVGSDTGDDAKGANWLFTLLWTIKECALKSSLGGWASLWNLAGIEIAGLPEPRKLLALFFGHSRFSRNFLSFTVKVKERARAVQVRIGITGTDDLILTVMRPSNGVAK